MQWLKWLASVLCLFILAACAAPTDPAELYKGETSEQIFTKGEQALRNKHYKEAIKRFDALDVQYPYSKHSELAELHIIYAYYMNEDYALAQSAAERYIHAWPANPHVVYAYYMRALSYYHQNLGVFERLFPVDLSHRDLATFRQAWNDFATVARQFPESEYAPAARQYMIHLRNVMARHELNVASFYYRQHAYVTAANRASSVIRYYQGSPSVKPALELLVKCYHALHATDSEKEVQRIIQYNYSKSQGLLTFQN